MLADMATGIPVVGSLLGGLSVAFASVGAAIAATPVGWLIAGAAAVAAAVYAIYKNWDNITAYFSEKFAGIKAAFQKNWLNGIVKALWEFNPVKILADAFNGLSKWLFDFDLYDAGKSLITRLISGVKSVATMLPKSVLKFLGIEGWANAPVKVSAAVAPAAGAKAATTTAPTVQTSAQRQPLRWALGITILVTCDSGATCRATPRVTPFSRPPKPAWLLQSRICERSSRCMA
jgi:hypothetical protein